MKRLLSIIMITFSFYQVKAQGIRTFHNLELAITPEKDVRQYSLFWGQSFINSQLIPYRFSTGLNYAYNTRTAGTYLGSDGSKTPTVKFDKSIGYGTVSIPISIELMYKSLGIGFSHDIISYSNKTFKLDSVSTASGMKLTSPGFSTLLSDKRNLTGNAYIVLTINDSFSVKGGVNNITSTYITSSNNKETGYTRLLDQSLYVAIRLNIER